MKSGTPGSSVAASTKGMRSAQRHGIRCRAPGTPVTAHIHPQQAEARIQYRRISHRICAASAQPITMIRARDHCLYCTGVLLPDTVPVFWSNRLRGVVPGRPDGNDEWSGHRRRSGKASPKGDQPASLRIKPGAPPRQKNPQRRCQPHDQAAGHNADADQPVADRVCGVSQAKTGKECRGFHRRRL